MDRDDKRKRVNIDAQDPDNKIRHNGKMAMDAGQEDNPDLPTNNSTCVSPNAKATVRTARNCAGEAKDRSTHKTRGRVQGDKELQSKDEEGYCYNKTTKAHQGTSNLQADTINRNAHNGESIEGTERREGDSISTDTKKKEEDERAWRGRLRNRKKSGSTYGNLQSDKTGEQDQTNTDSKKKMKSNIKPSATKRKQAEESRKKGNTTTIHPQSNTHQGRQRIRGSVNPGQLKRRIRITKGKESTQARTLRDFFPSTHTRNINDTNLNVTNSTTTEKNAEEGDGIQTTLNHEEGPDRYGDIMTPKRRNTFRVGFQNINGLPENKNHHKGTKLLQHVRDASYDVFMVAEVGLNWNNITRDSTWGERTRFNLDNKSVMAFNQLEDYRSAIQFGGTGVITTADGKSRNQGMGVDPSGLGRWAWCKIQGKEDHTTIFVATYRPTVSKKWLGSVYHQHMRQQQIMKGRDPCIAFEEDLGAQLHQWQKQGYHLVVGMDANENASDGRMSRLMYNLNLQDVYLHSHGQHKSPPSTFNRSSQTFPIDTIWCSPSISVSKAGFLDFYEGCESDHRCLWFDIEKSILFGHKESDPPVQASRLKSSDPRVVSRYNESLNRAFSKYNILQQLQKLENIPSHKWKLSHEEHYNTLHKMVADVKLAAESKIRKLRTGGIPWSPQLQMYRDRIELWSLVKKKRKGRKTSTTKIRRLMKKTGEMTALKKLLEQVLQELDQAYKDYKAARKEAKKWREDHLENLLDALASKHMTSREHQLRQMRRIEDQRRMGRVAKQARGKLGVGRVTKVFFTNDFGVQEEAVTRHEMEKAITYENISRFSQSEDTPAMQEDVLRAMGDIGDNTPVVEKVLSGTFDWNSLELPETAKSLYAQLKRPSQVEKESKEVSLSLTEHRRSWSKQKDRIASEPSLPSFGHHKAVLEDDELADIDRILRIIPYKHGFAPLKWRKFTDVSILKKEGVFLVDKMRTIQLMPAEFNINNKKLGRDAMKRAEQYGIIPPDQYGSRRKHKCVNAALNKRITMDILRQRRQAGALCSNDAKSCYDRIVHWFANIAIQRTGIQPEPVNSMFDTLRRAEHFVSTAYGVATKGYSADRNPPLQGIGQGNGAGPAVWALISAVLFQHMYQEGFHANLSSPLSENSLNFVGYAFVDDTDLVQVGDSVDMRGEEVAVKMQKCLSTWQSDIWCSGGALVPKKSHWTLVDFKWEGDRWSYRSSKGMKGAVQVLGTDGTTSVTLTRHEPKHAAETLGVYLAMDGNNVKATEELRKKMEKTANHSRTTAMSPLQAWFTLEASAFKTLEYPQAALTLSKSQWNYITAPILDVLLPKANIDRNFPRAVLFSAKSEHGLGLKHPWFQQMSVHLHTFFKAMWEPSTLTSKFLLSTYEQLHLEIGTSQAPFEARMDPFHAVATRSWISNLWSFMSEFHIKLTGPTARMLHTAFYKDHNLMDVFSNHYKGEQLRWINGCRLYLQVVFLSDICTSDGLRFREDTWEGKISKPLHSIKGWPRRPPSIPPHWWNAWREALAHCFGTRGTQELAEPLRVPPEYVPEDWPWWSNQENSIVWQRSESGTWMKWTTATKRSLRLSNKRFICTTEELTSKPVDAEWITVKDHQSYIFLDTGSRGQEFEEELQYVNQQELERARSLTSSWAVSKVDDDLEVLQQLLHSPNLTLVSDGSYKEGFCASATAITNGTDIFRCSNIIPGERKIGSSYRAELGGVIGSLQVIEHLQSMGGTNQSYTIRLDGQGAMTKASKADTSDVHDRDFDLLQEIALRMARLKGTFIWSWIEGHQVLEDNSPLDVKLNHDCDSRAKQRVQNLIAATEVLPLPNFEGWSLWLDSTQMSQITVGTIYNYTLGRSELSIWKYWEEKLARHTRSIHMEAIYWQPLLQAIQDSQHGHRRWYLKFVSGFTSTGEREIIRGTVNSAQCCRCGHENEDIWHIMKCRGQGARDVWTEAIDALRKWMMSHDTHPQIQQSITTGLNRWFIKGENTQGEGCQLPDIVLQQEQQLGWDNFLLGRIVKAWVDKQEQWFLESASDRYPKSGQRWAANLIRTLWTVVWKLWDHRNSVKNSLKSLQTPQEVQLRYDVAQRWINLPNELRDRVPEPKHLEWPVSALKAWIQSVEGTKSTRRYQGMTSAYDPDQERMRKRLKAFLAGTLGPSTKKHKRNTQT